jgi:hypothetical protein
MLASVTSPLSPLSVHGEGKRSAYHAEISFVSPMLGRIELVEMDGPLDRLAVDGEAMPAGRGEIVDAPKSIEEEA